jgi:NAD(P)-dependent dehydrogenase (short-subunit alcohol dehydrogenase family)
VDQTVILGASGGIGAALADAAEARGDRVVRLSRPALDLDDPESFARAAEASGDGLAHVIVATGVLRALGRDPERSWRELDAAALAEQFRVNAILPALVARHFLPRLARQRRAIFAVLTARVGSIGDNHLGGWYGYRMAKAAANQLVRTAAIELRRRNPAAVAVALHPGTVATTLSQPFQRNLAPGQLVSPEVAAAHLWRVIDALTPAESGSFRAWDGTPIPW